jgi:type IV pilus secretin PilQ/predicted competence protein
MVNPFKTLGCATAVLVAAWSLAQAQTSSPSPAAQTSSAAATQTTNTTAITAKTSDSSPVLLTQTSAAAAPSPATAAAQTTTTATTTSAASPAGTTTTVEPDNLTENGGVGVREFQGDDVGQVLRLLARQAKINMVVSEQVTGTVTMRLEDVTALQAIAIIVKAKNLFMDKIDNVYYIKTGAERTAEPTESDSYQFSYSRAKDTVPLIASQLASKDPPQVDERTNTLFFRETRGNIDNIRKLLVQIDKPTKQVMIEARLVEVTANPKQSYGINWAGTLGSSATPKQIQFAGSSPASFTVNNGVPQLDKLPAVKTDSTTGQLNGFDFLRDASHQLSAIGGQFAILSVPQLSATLRLLNEDDDAEFLANPRIVTADNQQAKIEISRNQPVPQLNFNEQTATAVFGGFQDKKFGNTLLVRPSVNKDDFITLSVKPEISNKVGDATFVFAGATVASPVIDTRSLESNVLIRSGNTLAIGGLLQDEQTKARNKVPVLGDIPILGYFFAERLNARTKRNLLVFVTPTIIDQRYGTGLEDQVSGLHHTGEEFADPNGWRNNAKGAIRLVPTAERGLAADYAKPGMPPPPEEGAGEVQFRSSAKDR